jgi:hypothetical protein
MICELPASLRSMALGKLCLPLESWPVNISEVLGDRCICCRAGDHQHTPTATIAIPLRKKLRALAPSSMRDAVGFDSWSVSRWATGGESNCWRSVAGPSSGEDPRTLPMMTANEEDDWYSIERRGGKGCAFAVLSCKAVSRETLFGQIRSFLPQLELPQRVRPTFTVSPYLFSCAIITVVPSRVPMAMMPCEMILGGLR